MLVALTKKEIGELLELLEAEINLNGNEDDLKPIVRKLQRAKTKKWWEIKFRRKDIKDRVEALKEEKLKNDTTNKPF